MNIKQFLFTNQKNKKGEPSLFPPIGDIGLIITGLLYYWLVTDWTYILGFIPMALGIVCFGLEYLNYKRQNFTEVKS